MQNKRFDWLTKLEEIPARIYVILAIFTLAVDTVLIGFLNLLFLAGFISVNIGIMNLLPFPALDGGRIFFILVECIIRRRIPPEKEGIVHFIGLVLLFGLMIFVTWNDIVRLFA